MKKLLATLLSLCMVFSMLSVSAFAAEEDGQTDFSGYKKGVTVEKDDSSPTGYTATFIYEQEPGYTTKDGKTLGKITKVELYSDCMMLFKPSEVPSGTSINGGSDHAHSPSEFQPGMYPAGGSGNTTYFAEMTALEDGLWAVQVPLTSGAFVYNFRVTDEDGTQLSRLDDPNNPTMVNEATKVQSLSSLVYVPYDQGKQGSGDWVDRSVELPQTDASKRGKVETISYTGAAGDTRGLAVYLPAGYSQSAGPYNVLYLSHGVSSDIQGNELRWMNEGDVANIMDNLVASGKTEPFVVVTMNNQDFTISSENVHWDQDKIWAEQELIMAKIEADYNVKKDASGRAFAGLSMGGYTTSTMYINHADQFSQFGIWSYANVDALTDEALENLKSANVDLMLAAGDWDYLLEPVKNFSSKLTGAGIVNEFLTVPGGHDWETWQLLFAYAAKNFFFKEAGFSDVAPSAYYYDAAQWALQQGIASGSTFNPDAPCTRGDMMTFIYRAAGSPDSSSEAAFEDVPATSDCYRAVQWAVEKGVTTGITATTFGPGNTVTRGQAVTFLYRAAGSPAVEGEKTAFTDVAAGSYYENAVQWAAANGITNGTTATTFSPNNTCTRGQIISFLYRAK